MHTLLILHLMQPEKSKLIIEEDGVIIEQKQEYNPDTGDMSIEVITLTEQPITMHVGRILSRVHNYDRWNSTTNSIKCLKEYIMLFFFSMIFFRLVGMGAESQLK